MPRLVIVLAVCAGLLAGGCTTAPRSAETAVASPVGADEQAESFSAGAVSDQAGEPHCLPPKPPPCGQTAGGWWRSARANTFEWTGKALFVTAVVVGALALAAVYGIAQSGSLDYDAVKKK